ncbi:MAG: glycosyltransferase family 2 protein [Cyclobacteriaceae bacterium]
MPVVSIIVPNYNHAHFLKERLDSIFNQSYQDFEVILLDDASSDKSQEILSQYAKRPKVTQYVVNKTNSGSPFKQWRKGIELTKGKYIWIAESDDVAELDFLRRLISRLEEDNDIGIAFCRSKIINNKGKAIGFSNSGDQFSHVRWSGDFVMDGVLAIKEHFRFSTHILNASSVVVRKSAIKSPFYFQSYRYSGDWRYYLDILMNHSISFTYEPLSIFRRSESSHTWAKSSLISEWKRMSERKKNLCLANNISGLTIRDETDKYLWMCYSMLAHLNSKNYLWVLLSNCPIQIKICLIRKAIYYCLDRIGLAHSAITSRPK